MTGQVGSASFIMIYEDTTIEYIIILFFDW